MPSALPVAELVARELRLIRSNVPGVRGGVTATSDGLVIGQDVHDLEPTQIAALVAALHAVAARASVSTDCGQLKEVLTRSTGGYLAVYAAGSTAIVALLGTPDLNVAMLNYQTRKIIDRIAGHSAGLARQLPVSAAGAEIQEAGTVLPEAETLPSRRHRGA